MRVPFSSMSAPRLFAAARVVTGLVLLVAGSRTTHAGVITQTRAFDLETPFSAGSGATADAGFSFFERFDESLGSLTRVDVSITGFVAAQGQLPVSQVCTLGCVPSPYAFSLNIVHDFGLWTLSGGAGDPRIVYSGTAPGMHSPNFFARVDFSHEMSFTETTDLVGFAPISSSSTSIGSLLGAPANVIPPVISNLERGDFDAPVSGIPLAWVFPQLSWIATGIATGNQNSGTSIQGQLSSDGSVTLTYFFDEATTPSIPEPTTITLIILGLAGARFLRRRLSVSQLSPRCFDGEPKAGRDTTRRVVVARIE